MLWFEFRSRGKNSVPAQGHRAGGRSPVSGVSAFLSCLGRRHTPLPECHCRTRPASCLGTQRPCRVDTPSEPSPLQGFRRWWTHRGHVPVDGRRRAERRPCSWAICRGTLVGTAAHLGPLLAACSSAPHVACRPGRVGTVCRALCVSGPVGA